MDEEHLSNLLLRGCAGKVKIQNKEQADVAIDDMALEGRVMYYYLCHFCSKYHLTSSPPNQELNENILRALIEKANTDTTVYQKSSVWIPRGRLFANTDRGYQDKEGGHIED